MYSKPKQFSKLFLPRIYLNARLLVGVLFCGGHVLFCFVFAKSVIYVNTPEGEQPGTKYKRSVQRLDPYAADARSTNPQKSKESNAKESFVSQKKRE